MKTTALIMAGGKGERFWPKSRKSLPKQFLVLTNDKRTMIQLTVERILPLVDMEDIYIVTNKDYKELVSEQLPEIPKENILCEPEGRNTAPCIGLGAFHISKKYEDAVMMVLPSDSLIKDGERYRELVKEACELAKKGNNLVTMGIKPNYPETGYGYIKFSREEKEGNAFKVDRFVEKPSLEVAREYLATGEYLWNAGMFVWKVSTILSLFKEFLPDMYKGLGKIADAIGTPEQEKVLEKVFPQLESISIDYGIMEKAGSIYTIPGDYGWDDVGSWLAVGRIKKADNNNNVLNGRVITVNTGNCIIEAKDKLIAAVGLENIVVIDTEDATLICNKDSCGDIKKVLENLRQLNYEEYL
ncbi:MAG: NTP transferase domain-containing protein [Lachnospiraceae bacterium]|nr:NTP transferase domain-containing protein [Lachnospiraceae bacterium]